MIDLSLSLVSCLAYLVGSIPSGFIIARLKGLADIREHGSGSTGATNVARTLGLRYFFIVFALDFLKACAVLAMLMWYGYSLAYAVIAAFFLLLGNGFPVFLGFRGGKGVATSFGILAILQPYLLLCAFMVWVAVFVLSKTVGVASVVTLALMPLCSVFIIQEISWIGLFIFFISLWGLFLHRSNIKNFYCSR